MEIKFADTFTASLEKMIARERWYWKLFDLFRYDIPRFIKNVWRFRRALKNHYWWDHHGTLMFLEIGLDHMATMNEKHGMEVDESRLKKVAAMKRAVELIKHYNEDLYIEMAEAELGPLVLHDWEFEEVPDKPGFSQLVDKDTKDEKKHNSKVFKRAREISEDEWNELWKIIRGQDVKKFKKGEDWNKFFDGSGMRGWWD